MQISFRTYPVLALLKGYIHKIWIFESCRPMPDDDMKLVVPNGRLLMVIPFRNGLLGKKDGRSYVAKTHSISLVGMSDSPSIVDAVANAPVGIIGVEFSPLGAYRFFRMNMSTLAQKLNKLTDMLPTIASDLEDKLQEQPNLEEKLITLQDQLLSLALKTEKDHIFEYCIHQIHDSEGIIRIKELEKKTGYSSRWLNMKFDNLLGMNPKSLSSIVRFQKNYQAMILNPDGFFNRKDFFDHYHDGSHFFKNFKRYTGYAPGRIVQLKNDFGRTFYQD